VIVALLERIQFRNDDTGWTVARFRPHEEKDAPAVPAARAGASHGELFAAAPPRTPASPDAAPRRGPPPNAAPPPGVRVDDQGRFTGAGMLAMAAEGEVLELHGHWERHRRFGDQFRVDAYTPRAPRTPDAIAAYLGSGLVKGLGPVLAGRLVDRFGAATLEIIEAAPERLREVPGVGARKAAALTDAWAKQRAVREVMLFLQGQGVSPAWAARIYRHYGPGAVAAVKADPYRLARDVPGIGFKIADDIARKLGIPADAPRRIEAGALHVLRSFSDAGHCFAPRVDLCEQARAALGVDVDLVGGAVDRLTERGEMVAEPRRDLSPAMWLPELRDAEVRLAGRLRALGAAAVRPVTDAPDKALAWFEEESGLKLADSQRRAVEAALREPVLVITGGPGTGKTTLTRAIVRLHERKRRTVALAAPTGRAAKRLGEACGLDASTIHRLLEFDPRQGVFQRNADEPLAADLVVVDEASMLDLPLAEALCAAVPVGARLVLVGDVDQLPPVGAGNVLRDVIESRAVPVVRLTQVFRQGKGSDIVHAAHAINAGEMPHASGDPHGEFHLVEREDPDQALETIVELVTARIPRAFGLDPLADVQVLAPMRKGRCGIEGLNEALRERLVPPGPELRRGATGFRPGDKVMQLKNNYELEVFNGDLGRVVEVNLEEGQLAVSFDGRLVSYASDELDQLVLALAISVHKSQGSEYPAVVMPLLSEHYIMLQRNLLYTAVTRARRLVVLVGGRRAVGRAVHNARVGERHTRLAERLAEMH
jgi:exodeoxyribonuclease V alpha subunit